MQNDSLERMKKLLDQFDALERRVNELQTRTAGILRDFEHAVQPKSETCDAAIGGPSAEEIEAIRPAANARPKFESAWRI